MIYNKTFEHIKSSSHLNDFCTIDEFSKHYKCDVYEILIFLINYGIIEINNDGFKLTKIGKDFTDGEDLKCCKFEPIIGNMILYDLIFHKHNYDISLCEKLEHVYNGNINIKNYNKINQFEIEITLLQELYHLNEVYLSDDSLEIPKYMDDVLNNNENETLFNAFKHKNNVLFTFSQNPRIDITLTETDGYYAIHALDYSINRITFYAKIEFGNINPNDYDLKTHSKYSALRYVAVKNVYRDRNFKNTKGLPEKLYLDYFVNRYGTLFSDHTQTKDGKDYWLRLIPKFFSNNLNVYVFNYGDPSLPSAPLQYPKAYGTTNYNHGDAIKFRNAAEFKSFLIDNNIWENTNTEYQNIRIVVPNINYSNMIEDKYLKLFNLPEYNDVSTVSILQSYTNDWNISYKMLVSMRLLNGEDYSITEYGKKYLESSNGKSYIFDYYIFEMLYFHTGLFLYGKQKYGIINSKYIHHSLINDKTICGINDGNTIMYKIK